MKPRQGWFQAGGLEVRELWRFELCPQSGLQKVRCAESEAADGSCETAGDEARRLELPRVRRSAVREEHHLPKVRRSKPEPSATRRFWSRREPQAGRLVLPSMWR